MAEFAPRTEQVDHVGRHLIVELCQFLYLLRILVVAVFVVRPSVWDQDVLWLLALVTMPALVATFWLPRLVDAVRSNPLFAAVDVAALAVALFLTGNEWIILLVSLFAAASIGLLYAGARLVVLTGLLAIAYLVASVRVPEPNLGEIAVAILTYGAVAMAASTLQRRVAQLTDYGIAASSSVSQLYERARLAREMHDGVVKTLHGIALAATGLARTESLDPTTRRQLATFAQAAEYGVKQARETLVELRVDQDDRPFGVVLEELVARWSARTGIEQHTTIAGLVDVETGPRVELLACVREALDNVAEHAKATRVDVSLARRGDDVVLEIRDDGKGMDAGRLRTARRQGHFGVHGMSERMASVGGWISVAPHEGQGTTVTCGVRAA